MKRNTPLKAKKPWKLKPRKSSFKPQIKTLSRSKFGRKNKKKASSLSKQSKQKISVVQRKLWSLCKELIRTMYPNICYTCGQAPLSGTNWHTGHLWSKASLGAYLKYDIRVLRPQCYNCNMNRGGMGADFYSRMLREEGKEYMEKLEADRKVEVRAMDHYLALIEYYQTLLNNK